MSTGEVCGEGEGGDFLRSVGGVMIAQGDGEIAWNFGLIGPPGVGAKGMPEFGQLAPHLVGAGAGKVVLLYEAARKVMGRDLDLGPQKIGDCVSWGWSGSVDLVACVSALSGSWEFSWDMRTCTEAMYALSRVEYGNFDGSYQDGSVGSWAAKAASKGGTLTRKRLGAYDPRRAKEWGAKGLPDDLEPDARLHLVKTVSLVTTFEQARDAIASGYPVPVCSGQGFSQRRDNQGFDRASGSWAHCMKFVGARDDARPGLLCMNSWGVDGVSGPKGEFDIPDGSFWVDAQTCTRMLREQDSYAVSNFDGYPAQTIPWVF